MLHRFKKSRFWCNNDGAAAVEMAFAVPIFIFFLLGTVGFGHAFWVYNSLQYAVDHGGRYTMLHPSAPDTEIANAVRNNVYGINTSSLTITITSDTTGLVDYRTIALSYNYNFLSGTVSFLPSFLTARVTVPTII